MPVWRIPAEALVIAATKEEAIAALWYATEYATEADNVDAFNTISEDAEEETCGQCDQLAVAVEWGEPVCAMHSEDTDTRAGIAHDLARKRDREGDTMNATDAIGCTADGATYCPQHCPDPDACKTWHGAIFPTSETDCSPETCDACRAEIATSVIHYFDRMTGACRYCGAECDHVWGNVELARMTGTPHRTCCACGMISLDTEEE